MNIDEKAQEYILELETINDIQSAVIEEQEEVIKMLKAQVQSLHNAQKVDYGVA
jgi:hypothetical protein